MKSFDKHIKIKSTTENLSLVRDFTKETAVLSGLDNETINKIILAVDEACTNIIKHAYKYSTDGEIVVKASFDNKKFAITLIDKGDHFNSNIIPNPNLKEYIKEKRIGGLGMFLMKKLMDEVVYSNLSDDSNQVILVKYIN